MRPPTRIQVGPRTYTLSIDAARAEAHDAIGVCLTKLDEILLSPIQGEQTMRVTVVHELIHAAVYDAGDQEWLSEDGEEKICQLLAPRLLDLLRRNPRLVAYLAGQ